MLRVYYLIHPPGQHIKVIEEWNKAESIAIFCRKAETDLVQELPFAFCLPGEEMEGERPQESVEARPSDLSLPSGAGTFQKKHLCDEWHVSVELHVMTAPSQPCQT